MSLNRAAVLKSLVVAVPAAVYTWLAQVFNAPDFDFATIHWDELLKIAVMVGAAYLSKNLFSTADGKFLGKVG